MPIKEMGNIIVDGIVLINAVSEIKSWGGKLNA